MGAGRGLRGKGKRWLSGGKSERALQAGPEEAKMWVWERLGL